MFEPSEDDGDVAKALLEAMPELLQSMKTASPQDIRVRARIAFEEEYWATHPARCGNCGSDHRLILTYAVPPEAGGVLREDNVLLLCRTCKQDSDAYRAGSGGEHDRKPINFWISNTLHQTLSLYCGNAGALFGSVTSLIRFLVQQLVEHPEVYDDLAQWQDAGGQVKITAWVDRDVYTQFKQLLNEEWDMTVTAGLQGLLKMYATRMTERAQQGGVS